MLDPQQFSQLAEDNQALYAPAPRNLDIVEVSICGEGKEGVLVQCALDFGVELREGRG